MVRGAEAGKETLIALIREALPDGATSDFAVGHVDAANTARWFRRQIEHYFKPAREIFITDASPALATHTGFGTVAVAYLLPGGRSGLST
jgi:fatty acid-binding protein DegV